MTSTAGMAQALTLHATIVNLDLEAYNSTVIGFWFLLFNLEADNTNRNS